MATAATQKGGPGYCSPKIFTGAAAPVVSNDQTLGYESGDIFVDTTNGNAYVCISAGTGAAVWLPTAGPAEGSSPNSIGGSTAAAGSTTTDAGVLPAATGNVYPTTAADGTKGVRVHASDKVTGRMLFVGNGVSNTILKVYPPSGGTINGAAADAAFSSVSGKGVIIVCLSSAGNTWLAF